MSAQPPTCNLLVVRSGNIERAAAFYSAALGLEMAPESHGAGPRHFVSTRCGLVFEIYPLKPGQPPTTGTRLGFQVADVDRVAALVVQHGGTVVTAPGDTPRGRHAVVADPDGHRVELLERGEGHE